MSDRRYVVRWNDDAAQWEVIDNYSTIPGRGLYSTRLEAQLVADTWEGIRVS